MKKKIVALGVALCVFASSVLTSLAAETSKCPSPHAVNGKHYFADSKVTGGHVEVVGYHSYAVKDDNGKAVIKNDCLLTQAYEHVIDVCYFCGAEDPNSAKSNPSTIWHSIIHD